MWGHAEAMACPDSKLGDLKGQANPGALLAHRSRGGFLRTIAVTGEIGTSRPSGTSDFLSPSNRRGRFKTNPLTSRIDRSDTFSASNTQLSCHAFGDTEFFGFDHDCTNGVFGCGQLSTF